MSRSASSVPVEQYALCFVDAAGKITGYLDRSRAAVTEHRESAYEFDEHADANRIVADATRVLYGKDGVPPLNPTTFIEIKELWELSSGPE